jgi:hypothetical protein
LRASTFWMPGSSPAACGGGGVCQTG